MKYLIVFVLIALIIKKAWKPICQKIADFYFYRGLSRGFASVEGGKDLDNYNKWIDIKFGIFR